MKRILAVFLLLVVFSICGCSSGNASSTDYNQVFERIISGDEISQYISYGTEGLVSEYEYVEHHYHRDGSKAFETQFNYAYVFANEQAAQKRFESIKRTYGDSATISGKSIYINQLYVYSDYEMSYKLNFEEEKAQRLSNGYIEVPAAPKE
jgi:hypothetical protein